MCAFVDALDQLPLRARGGNADLMAVTDAVDHVELVRIADSNG
jgi:hypothetical protein